MTSGEVFFDLPFARGGISELDLKASKTVKRFETSTLGITGESMDAP